VLEGVTDSRTLRWRVGLQFVAILLLMGVLWFTQRGS
jgi:hypothetical protein